MVFSVKSLKTVAPPLIPAPLSDYRNVFSNEENAPLLVVVVVAVSKIQVISKNQTNTNTNMN